MIADPKFLPGDLVRVQPSGYLATVVKPLRASIVAKSQPYSLRVHTAIGERASWAPETDLELVERAVT